MTHHAAAFPCSRLQHSPMSKLRSLLLWLTCLVCLVSALPITGLAQTNVPASCAIQNKADIIPKRFLGD